MKLYIFPAAFGLRNLSPFCLKAEMVLSHLGLEFEIVELNDPRKAPLGKLPYIEDEGKKIADSEIINEYLDQKTGGGLFGDLTAAEKAKGLAFTRLAEDHLYFTMVASRWLDDTWFPNVVVGFFGALPGPMPALVGRIARSQFRKAYLAQGLGKHDLSRQQQFARDDFAAINAQLEVESYIAGQRLTVYDFPVASLIAGIADQKPHSWINPILDEFPRLKDYAEKVQAEVGVYCRLGTE